MKEGNRKRKYVRRSVISNRLNEENDSVESPHADFDKYVILK